MSESIMKKVILATIPHTGTHFFKKLLEDHGFEVKAIHVTDNGLKQVNSKVSAGWVLVTTYRNIDRVLKSWHMRGREGQSLNQYLENWYTLHQWEPIVVSFDNNREARLEFLSAVLDVELKTDWESVNVTPRKYDIKTDTFTPMDAA